MDETVEDKGIVEILQWMSDVCDMEGNVSDEELMDAITEVQEYWLGGGESGRSIWMVTHERYFRMKAKYFKTNTEWLKH